MSICLGASRKPKRVVDVNAMGTPIPSTPSAPASVPYNIPYDPYAAGTPQPQQPQNYGNILTNKVMSTIISTLFIRRLW